MNYIDAHSHIWTPDTTAYPLAPGYRRLNMEPPSFTAEELQAQMKPVGVNRVVLIQMSFYGFDNSYMLDMMKKYPGMFAGVAVIDQDSERPDIEMRKLRGLGVTGFRIVVKNQMPEKWLAGPAMQKMWATGSEQGQAMCCLIETDALPEIDRMCQKYPQTPVVIDHICRIGVSGTIAPEPVQALNQLARHKNVYVKISAFYALGKKQVPYMDLAGLIERVYRAYGPERLMWATDCPYQVQGEHTYKASIDLIHNLPFLSAEDREWILRKTAEQVFFQK